MFLRNFRFIIINFYKKNHILMSIMALCQKVCMDFDEFLLFFIEYWVNFVISSDSPAGGESRDPFKVNF